ncbi:uncharacterized protein LOC101857998 [Aplysia californica]|uniref:Uncharacterized protein LOC101857998 n=1 Tax=Aplysia californica TaxID=6500 RepID=A0ABM0KAE4_APLCA|nr:uncharacterized protein LOC101857998 [Aplysia californica]
MKSVATERPRAGILGVKKDANCSIMKTTSTGIEFRGEKFTLSEEMRECFLQLSNMVPEVPRNEDGNIDGTVLMQYVIDYILDLELQLGGGQSPFSPAAAFTSSLQARLVESANCRDSREPLSEKSIDNIVHTQIPASSLHLSESLVQRTTDCDIRPPSK